MEYEIDYDVECEVEYDIGKVNKLAEAEFLPPVSGTDEGRQNHGKSAPKPKKQRKKRATTAKGSVKPAKSGLPGSSATAISKQLKSMKFDLVEEAVKLYRHKDTRASTKKDILMKLLEFCETKPGPDKDKAVQAVQICLNLDRDSS
jgi:hypothetical protein